MSLHIYSVFDPEFAAYGRVVDGYDYTELLDTLQKVSPCPGDAVIYVPGDDTLEALAVKTVLQNNCYGGMPIQIGYCNGTNHTLNAVEYHRDSEIDIALDGAILLIGSEADVEDDFTYDTAKMEAFAAPAGAVVELYATTLHYAPINAEGKENFRVVIILPEGTNTEPPVLSGVFPEDKLMTAKNKWLIAHAESNEGKGGAFVGLKGENITIK